MKKIRFSFAFLTILALALCLTACDKDEKSSSSQASSSSVIESSSSAVISSSEESSSSTAVVEKMTAEDATAYLFALYKEDSTTIGGSFERPVKTMVFDDADNVYTFDNNWSIKVLEGGNTAAVSIADGATGFKKIVVDTFTTVETKFELTVTCVNVNDATDTDSYTWTLTIPKFELASYADWKAAESGTELKIRGVVAAREPYGVSSAGKAVLYLHDESGVGGYEAYALTCTEEEYNTDLAIGNTVVISGTKTLYYGIRETDSSQAVTYTLVSSEKKEVTSTDITSMITSAADLSALTTSLDDYQSRLVTIKGAKITAVDTATSSSRVFLNLTVGDFDLGSVALQINKYTTPFDGDTFKALQDKYAIGYTINLYGIYTTYSSKFSVLCYDENSIEVVSTELSAEDKITATTAEIDAIIPENFAADGNLTLPAAGTTNDDVELTYEIVTPVTSAAIEDGKLVVVLQDTEQTIELKVTFTVGTDVEEKTYTITVDAASAESYIAKTVEAPAVGTAYKLALEQTKLGTTLYFAGAMSGNYFASTEKAEKATDVFVEACEGGFHLYFMDGETKTYIEIYLNDSSKNAVRLATEATAVWTYNDTYKTYTVTLAETEYYIGTYSTYATFSSSNVSYAATSFVSHMSTLAVADYKPVTVEAPAVDTAYKLALEQTKLGTTLYFAGAMSGNYFASTDKYAKATDVFVEACEGGFHLYFMDGETKTYIEIYLNDSSKNAVRLATEATAVWTYNDTYKTYTVTLAETEYYIGTYSTYATFSSSNVSYAATSFVSHMTERGFVEAEAEEPEEPKEYATIETLPYTEGFETGYTSGSTYNNTTEVLIGDDGKQWATYYGTVSTTGTIGDTMSMQMRWYTSATTNLGYARTDFIVKSLKKITFLAADTNGLNVKVEVSTDGTTWTGAETFTLSTTATTYTYELAEAADVLVRFTVVLPETLPTGTSRVYIDNVAFLAE